MEEAIEKIDKKYIWHPFTQMKEWVKNEQLVIKKGRGVYLYDTKGRKYLDGVSSLWVTVHGHRKKELDHAIKEQLNKIAHSTLLGLANEPSVRLSEELVKITPKGLEKVFFSDNGSTAVEIALKMAFQYRQLIGQKRKTKFVTLINAYHGDTIGSVSLGGIDLFHKIYRPLLFKAFKAPSPYCYRCVKNCRNPGKIVSGSENCIRELKKIIRSYSHRITALIVEPMMQAAAGMLTMPRGYLSTAGRLCKENDILLICDEVATGFGRTGRMFASEHENISPDIICLAKGITGGYLPLAATLTSKKIYNAFLGENEEQKTFFHGHTYTGNPLACAAAAANLDLFRKGKIISRLQGKIAFLCRQLERFKQLSVVGDIRQCGFMVGIELVSDNRTKEAFPLERQIGHRVIIEARRRGAILRPLGNVIVLMPPLSITLDELSKLLEITFESIRAVV